MQDPNFRILVAKAIIFPAKHFDDVKLLQQPLLVTFDIQVLFFSTFDQDKLRMVVVISSMFSNV